MTASDVTKEREKKGQCVKCTQQLFKVKRIGAFRSKKPLTIQGLVENGRCMICDSRAGDVVLAQVSTTAQAVDSHSATAQAVDSHIATAQAVDSHSAHDEPSSGHNTSNKSIMSNDSSSAPGYTRPDMTSSFASVQSTSVSVSSNHSSGHLQQNYVEESHDDERKGLLKDDGGGEGLSLYENDEPEVQAPEPEPEPKPEPRERRGRSRRSSTSVQFAEYIFSLVDFQDLVDTMNDTHAQAKMQILCCDAMLRLMKTPDGMRDFSEVRGSVTVIDAIDEHFKSRDLLMAAYELLSYATSVSIAVKNHVIEFDGIVLSNRVGQEYVTDSELSQLVWKVISNCCDGTNRTKQVVDKNVVSYVLHVLCCEDICTGTQGAAVDCMANIAKHSSKGRIQFIQGEGMSVFVPFMFMTESIGLAQVQCCGLISALGKDDKLNDSLIGEGCLLQVNGAMSAHPKDPDVQEACCKAFVALMPMGHQEIMEFGGFGFLAAALENHQNNGSVLKEVLYVIGKLIRCDSLYPQMISTNFPEIRQHLQHASMSYPACKEKCDFILDRMSVR
eukprot:CAMPEP_0116019366 /NCGR_PEP_ID=MMETSP0321-20121206/9197_1 /TAXON_ID=163516 /ORGANISM="Leptocylindrus danicus var. danicus, Strain B650" /LENGTH=556 /DNA_ID=CAMNT_0003489929 /DNA_START=248 /DNA_END=1921 /DNA_ORIENTATION=-